MSCVLISSVGLQITVSIYIAKLKRVSKYRQDITMIRVISLVISVLLMLKGIDILMVYVYDKHFDSSKDEDQTAITVFNCFRLVFYFLETGPSIFIVITHFHTYKQYK